MKNKELVLTYLKLSKDKWISGKELQNYLKQPWEYKPTISPAEIRKIICELRLEGNLIIAGPYGYCLTDNNDLISKYIKSRWGELTREMKPLKAMAEALNMLDQLTLWDI